MTQEEKLKEAKRLYKTANSDQRYVLESLFPELKESDDEKIRKSLIELFKDMEWDDSILHDYNMDKDKTIAWLEKQGEQKSTDKIQIGKEYKCIASPKYSTFMRGKIYKPEDKFLCSFMNFCSDCFEPIEDSKLKFKPGDRVRNKKSGLEQTLGGCIVDVYEGAFPFRIKDQDEWELVDEKSSDKVESKFEVGDWIVQENIGVYRVIEVCECWYEVVDNKGKGYSIGFDKEYMLRLWTVADAKDGDVLVDCNKDEVILMFRGIGNTKWDDVIDYHCYYSCSLKSFCVQKGVEYWGTVNCNELEPATKEQCATLERAMANAGYRWDNEKKELTRI